MNWIGKIITHLLNKTPFGVARQAEIAALAATAKVREDALTASVQALQARVEETRNQLDEITLSLQLARETRFDEYQRLETFRNQVLNLFAKGFLPEIVVLDVRTAPKNEWEMEHAFHVRVLVSGVPKHFSLVSYKTDCTDYYDLQDRHWYRQYIPESQVERAVLNELADAHSLEEIVLKSMGCLSGDFYRIVEVNSDVPKHELMRFEISDRYFARYGNPEQVTQEHEQSA